MRKQAVCKSRQKSESVFLPVKSEAWKEEGLADFYAAESSYNADEGIKRILSDTPDNSNSYRYFTYRTAVSYMMNHEGKSQAKVLKDKRGLVEVLAEVRSLGESEIKEMMR